MRVDPLRDNVLVERLEADERSKGGILIPDSAKEKPRKGRVVAIGPGKIDDKDGRLRSVAVCVDDVVLFNRYAGQEVEIDGKEMMLLPEDAVLAVVYE